MDSPVFNDREGAGQFSGVAHVLLATGELTAVHSESIVTTFVATPIPTSAPEPPTILLLVSIRHGGSLSGRRERR